jgi:hypothetical protein
MSETAARLERLASVLREVPVSERTEGILASHAMLMQRIMETSPADQADLALALAKAMRR